MITDAVSFGKALRAGRRELGYTQAFLSEVSGLSVSFISDLENGKSTAELGRAIKYYATELSYRIEDECVQLFGGYGVCTEVPIARQLGDARLSRFMGGTSETQLVVIAGGLGIK